MGEFEIGGGGLVKVFGVTAAGAVVPLKVASDGKLQVGSLDCSTPAIYNVTLTLADTQYSQAIPDGTHKVIFRCRSAAVVRYAWETGKVATPTAPYQTLPAGAEYGIDGMTLIGKTLYLASSTAGVVVELEVWS